jgi:hypothetical protein
LKGKEANRKKKHCLLQPELAAELTVGDLSGAVLLGALLNAALSAFAGAVPGETEHVSSQTCECESRNHKTLTRLF